MLIPREFHLLSIRFKSQPECNSPPTTTVTRDAVPGAPTPPPPPRPLPPPFSCLPLGPTPTESAEATKRRLDAPPRPTLRAPHARAPPTPPPDTASPLAPGAACTTRSDGPWRRGKVAALLVTNSHRENAGPCSSRAPKSTRRLEIRSPAPTIAPTCVPWPVALSVSPAAARPSGEGARGLPHES